jgi:hypothetical protein
MPQDPMLVDQLQIAPGEAGTRLIRRAADGSIEFLDAVVTGGITLQQLAGLQAVGGVKVVGKSGAGAEFPTIQSAVDTVPVTAGPLEPYVILIGPGVYAETIDIVRDWVFLIGLGGVVLEPLVTTPNAPGAYHTVVVQADLGTIPKHVVLRNLTIRNYHDNFACVRVFGSAGSEVGETGIDIDNCSLEATAPGGNRTVWASSVNFVNVKGGTFEHSNAISLTRAEECAGVTLMGVESVTGVQLDYDTGGTLPSLAGSTYLISSCPDLGLASTLSPQVRSTLLGAGALNLLNCGRAADVTVGGDQTLDVVGTALGALVLNDTTTATLTGSARSSVSAAAGATLAESYQSGQVSFVATMAQAVLLPTTHPDTNYRVVLEFNGPTASQDTAWITAKTTTGFTINFSFNQTLTVYWAVLREG